MSFNFLKRILSRKSKQPKWSIVIDPGHGGSQQGAINKTYGYSEKYINFHVAKFMMKYIDEKVPEMVAWPTRRTDRTLSLPDRCRLANTLRQDHPLGDKPVDAFISIHTNARPMKGRYGLEIETFCFRGSEEGHILAKRIQEALLLCNYAGLSTIDRGVKIGQRRGRDGTMKPFYVLKHTNMTAVLVELGFLSDDEEAQLLIKPENQEIMAKAIVDGVVEWLTGRNDGSVRTYRPLLRSPEVVSARMSSFSSGHIGSS